MLANVLRYLLICLWIKAAKKRHKGRWIKEWGPTDGSVFLDSDFDWAITIPIPREKQANILRLRGFHEHKGTWYKDRLAYLEAKEQNP